MCSDNEHPFFGQALIRDLHQPNFNPRREGSRSMDIETQLDAGRGFIYMLPSRTGRLDITFREFPFVEEDRFSYSQKDLIYTLIANEGTALETRRCRSDRFESERVPFGEHPVVRGAGQYFSLEHKRDHSPCVFLVLYVCVSKPF